MARILLVYNCCIFFLQNSMQSRCEVFFIFKRSFDAITLFVFIIIYTYGCISNGSAKFSNVINKHVQLIQYYVSNLKRMVVNLFGNKNFRKWKYPIGSIHCDVKLRLRKCWLILSKQSTDTHFKTCWNHFDNVRGRVIRCKISRLVALIHVFCDKMTDQKLVSFKHKWLIGTQ